MKWLAILIAFVATMQMTNAQQKVRFVDVVPSKTYDYKSFSRDLPVAIVYSTKLTFQATFVDYPSRQGESDVALRMELIVPDDDIYTFTDKSTVKLAVVDDGENKLEAVLPIDPTIECNSSWEPVLPEKHKKIHALFTVSDDFKLLLWPALNKSNGTSLEFLQEVDLGNGVILMNRVGKTVITPRNVIRHH